MLPGAPLNLGPFEDLDRLALAELDDRLLPAGLAAADHPAPLRLRPDLDDVDGLHLHVEELLNGLPDLRLVGVRMHAKGVLPVLDQAVALLGDDRREQNLVRMEAHAAPLLSSASRADSVTSRERAQTIAATSISAGVMTRTRSRFRKDLISVSSSSLTTTSTGACLPHASSRPTACFVEGSSNADPSTNASVPSFACAERAARKAALRAFLLTLTSKLVRGWKATPPPVQCGARVVPARARPVPFWRHGFPRPPATRPRLLTAREPGANGLVNEVRLHLGAEDPGLEGDVLRLLARRVEERCLRSRHHAPPRGSRRWHSSGPGRRP